MSNVEPFQRASELAGIQCEWCGSEVSHKQIMAVRPRDKAVMCCEYCLPDPPEGWINE